MFDLSGAPNNTAAAPNDTPSAQGTADTVQYHRVATDGWTGDWVGGYWDITQATNGGPGALGGNGDAGQDSGSFILIATIVVDQLAANGGSIRVNVEGGRGSAGQDGADGGWGGRDKKANAIE